MNLKAILNYKKNLKMSCALSLMNLVLQDYNFLIELIKDYKI